MTVVSWCIIQGLQIDYREHKLGTIEWYSGGARGLGIVSQEKQHSL